MEIPEYSPLPSDFFTYNNTDLSRQLDEDYCLKFMPKTSKILLQEFQECPLVECFYNAKHNRFNIYFNFSSSRIDVCFEYGELQQG